MTSTLFTAAIVLGTIFLFITLFVLTHKRSHNKKLAKRKIVLADIMWKNKLELSIQETINNYLLAIDKVNFILLYINFSHHKEKVELIDLWQVKTVKVTTEDTSVYKQSGSKSIRVDKQVSKLYMDVSLVDIQEKTSLVLFEYQDGMQNFVETKKRADYWCQLINKAVQELPHPSRHTSRYA